MFILKRWVLGGLVLLLAGCEALPSGNLKQTVEGGLGRAAKGGASSCSVEGLDMANSGKWTLEQWKKAHDLCPEGAWAGVNYALHLRQAGNTRESLDLARRFEGKSPEARDLVSSLGGSRVVDPPKIETPSSWNFQRALDDYSDMVFVAIGNKTYGEGIDVKGTRFADQDARAMALFAEKALGIPAHLRILGAEGYTSARIRALLEPEGRLKELADQYNARRLFFYYSGHGIAPPETNGDGQNVARLLGKEAEPGSQRQASVPLKEIVEKVEQLGYRELILVVDACFSGNVATNTRFGIDRPTRQEATDDIRGLGPRAPTRPAARPASLSLIKITATRENQEAREDEQNGHGLMTYHLLRQLEWRQGRVVDVAALKRSLPPAVDNAAFTKSGVGQFPMVLGNDQTTLVRYR
ncbi:MAG: caspase family protein [Magnetococcales bacterium]|nr:caspase family protein [Magnetococcales bacterium]